MPDVVSAAGGTSSVVATITLPWIKVPTDPTLNTTVMFLSLSPIVRDEAQSVQWPIGREDAVVISSARRGAQGTVTVWRATATERAALEAILDARVPCLLQIPSEESGVAGDWWYVRFRSSSTQRITRVRDVTRGVELPWVEVRSP